MICLVHVYIYSIANSDYRFAKKTEKKNKPGSFLFEYIGAINRETPPVPSCLFLFLMTGGVSEKLGPPQLFLIRLTFLQ